MKWVEVEKETPRDDVDVFVLTDKGMHAVARYWSLTGQWLTRDNAIAQNDTVVKWKYEDAT